MRVASLNALDKLGYPEIADIAKKAIKDQKPALRVTGLNVLAKHDPQAALPALEQTLQHGTTIEKQGALATLAEMKLPAATSVLIDWMQKLVQQQVPAEIQLDLLKAAESETVSRTGPADYRL